ncbi:hypothetical protein NLJ89_g8803 [Agrocybe chaxingu]|uniref:Cation/H+ exchanger transmembrane domain-containing protein n=1 Tax=Agrocybe chaxingu TaxID=84603 RepID=A0A9W8JU72_9AGAR|nr:hypothetical protein NLJ89_g8803 [Agrocybe chaxingu]
MTDDVSRIQVSYHPPHIPQLLAITTYLYFLSFTSSLCGKVINAPLIGPLVVGIVFGPVVAGLLQESTQQTFIDVGYIGLVLIVFEAGLTTDISLLARSVWLSIAAALTGIAVPIGLSMALLEGAFQYGGKKAFAAGAALCSTSLGTTFALLTPDLKRTRVGCVLMGAALLDDVVGLVIAGIIPNIAASSTSWQTIVRPVLVSLGFAVLTPALAFCLHRFLSALPGHFQTTIHDSRTQLFLIITTLFGFVAGSKYAGTSELFGAYLAGAFMAHVFSRSDPAVDTPPLFNEPPSSSYTDTSNTMSTLQAHQKHLEPILVTFLGPVFFASIGAALPVGALFTANGSHQVVWRGIVYSILMTRNSIDCPNR